MTVDSLHLLKIFFFVLTDVTECKKEHLCGPNQDCINTLGSYQCVCKQGYAVTKSRADLGCRGKNTQNKL